MYIPVIKKIVYTNDLLLERSLPTKGRITVNISDVVEPFSELGTAFLSPQSVNLGTSLTIVAHKKVGDRFYSGEIIGTVNARPVKAPFGGTLIKVEDSFRLEQEKKEQILLSGVWGAALDVVEGHSVLLKAPAVALHFAACTPLYVEGELLVFPNPSESLQVQYLEKYSKSVYKKILYVGDFVGTALLEKAVNLGVGGIIAGSASRESFNFAKRRGVFLGVFSGFGMLKTASNIFDVLKNVSNRFVFVRGERHVVLVPVPTKFSAEQLKRDRVQRYFKKVKSGLNVLVLDSTHFGSLGVVEKVVKSRILVKLDDISTEVAQPNLLAVS